MKERIQSLAELADELADNELEMLGEYHPDWHTIRDQKFAELILRECEKIIRAEIAVADIDGEAERAWEMGMECGVGLMKEHFGVE